MNILFTICGRAGSKGFKNKNLKEMRGVPLAYYTLAAITGYMKEHPEDNVTVALNTDSEPLVEIIKKQTTIPVRYVKRKEELAGDVVPKVDVIKDTYLTCFDANADIVIDLDITSPVRRVEDVENIVAEYNKDRYDLVFSVVEARRSPYFNMVENKPDGYYRKICISDYTARQQAQKSYEMNASIYAYNPMFLNEKIEKTILDYNCGISVMPDYLVLDIDSEEDFAMMQYLHSYYCNADAGLMRVYEEARQICRLSN
ncbi:MAG: acylneuraminate cytidylyltransferase family protein [Lachnospiraceae bacterium]|jgi:CMP-N,N'-diacetyllegionaminic acid synthase|nr:acylneuraminate cytidylyltransferase family protein [Lachnospiraceae bacterium]